MQIERQTNGQTDVVISAGLLMLIQIVYYLWSLPGLLLPLDTFPVATKLLYPSTLWEAGIISGIWFN